MKAKLIGSVLLMAVVVAGCNRRNNQTFHLSTASGTSNAPANTAPPPNPAPGISYADVVTYYRNLMKNGGRELFKTPPMQQWDLGRYQEDSMAYPPSVVVKDYTWNGSVGYLQVTGTSEKRYKTIIQIVPATAPR